MRRLLLLASFVGLMADGMFGWGLGLAPGVSLKNALLYILIIIMAIEAAIAGLKVTVELPQIHVVFLLLFFLGLLSWVVNSFIGSYVDYRSFRSLLALKSSLLDHYLFFLVFFLGVRTEWDMQWLQKWLLVAIAAGNIATVMDTFNLPDLNVVESRRDGRVNGPLGEANQYGLFVALFLPILIARASIEQGFWRAFFWLGSAASFLVLLLTVSRGAFIALLLGAIFSSIVLRKHLNPLYVKRTLILSIVAVVVAVPVLGPEYSDLILQRIRDSTSGGDTYQMTSGRIWIWTTALGAMLDEPLSILTGYGWDTFKRVARLAPHNVYLGYFFELGILGLLLFSLLIFFVLLSAKRALDSVAADSPLLPGLLGFYYGFAILAIGIFSVDLTNPWYFVWAYTGLSLRGAMLLRNAVASGDPGATVESGSGPLAEASSGWPAGNARAEVARTRSLIDS